MCVCAFACAYVCAMRVCVCVCAFACVCVLCVCACVRKQHKYAGCKSYCITHLVHYLSFLTVALRTSVKLVALKVNKTTTPTELPARQHVQVRPPGPTSRPVATPSTEGSHGRLHETTLSGSEPVSSFSFQSAFFIDT